MVLQFYSKQEVPLVPKPDGKWRFTLVFVQLNACTGALEGWTIPNISDTLKRIGDAKPTVFGLIDFTAGYHQTPLDKIHEHSLHSYVVFDYFNGLVLPWDLRAQVLISNVVWQV